MNEHSDAAPGWDRRSSAHRKVAGDRRTMIDHAEAVEIATQAMAVGEAVAAERIRMAAEYEISKPDKPDYGFGGSQDDPYAPLRWGSVR